MPPHSSTQGSWPAGLASAPVGPAARRTAARQAMVPLLSQVALSNRLDRLASARPEKVEWKVEAGGHPVGSLLAAVAQQRDRAAFAQLFEFYCPRLNGHLLARGATAAVAEEIVQDVMLAVWHKAVQFDPARGSPGAWIFTLARNAFIDRVRREHRPAVDPSDGLLDQSGAQPPAETDGGVLDGESLRELADALNALPEEQRHVVRRSYFHGESMAMISAAAGLPIGTVKTRARLALSRLRELVTRRRPS